MTHSYGNPSSSEGSAAGDIRLTDFQQVESDRFERLYTMADEATVDLAVATAARAADPTISVQPPSEAEKYQYLRGNRYWVLPTQTLLFAPVLFSMAKFSLMSPWLYPFLAWVAIGVANTIIGTFSSNQRKRVTYADHVARVAKYAPAHWPSVDVFLPTAGEPLEVLVNTYRHVAALSYPGRVSVHVLDDGARGEVAAAASRFGFDYVVRPNRGVMKKAGNMLYAFAWTYGDLILVLDADFVPRQDMLLEMVPYFEDASIGIVQSPQYFDTTTQQNWLQRTAGATQELFYRWVQPSRDGLGVAICVGTSAIYRRSALRTAGGFAQIEHSEDVHTGVKLRKAGFGLRYVPVLLSKGLCPAEMKPFISQQYRWATGSMSLMKDPSFYREADLSLPRLMPFLSGFMYYLTTAIAVFVSMLPGPIMMWFYPEAVNPQNYLPLLGGPIVWFLMMPLASRSRWRVEVLRVQALYSFAHAKAVWDTAFNRTAGWVPTGAKKAPNPVAKVVMRMIRIVIPLNILGLITGVAHVSATTSFMHVWPAAVYSLIYGYLALPLLLAPKVVSWRDVPALVRTSLSARRTARIAA